MLDEKPYLVRQGTSIAKSGGNACYVEISLVYDLVKKYSQYKSIQSDPIVIHKNGLNTVQNDCINKSMKTLTKENLFETARL